MKSIVTRTMGQAMPKGLSSMHFLVVLLLSFLSMPAWSQSPTAPALGFNVFLQKGATLINNETEGPVAMGGDLTLSQNSYQVSTNYPGTFKVNGVTVTLVVGGMVNYNGGNGLSVNQNGYVKIGTANSSKVWYTDQNNAYSPIRITPGSDYNGSPRINLQANAQQLGVSTTNNPVFQSNVIDFDAAFTQLKTSSASISACTDNANLTNANGSTIAHTSLPNQVKINLHTGTNTLNLLGSDMNSVQDFVYNNKPDANHVLVINVNASGTFNWSVWNSGGIGFQDCPYVLYNFYNTTTLNIQGNGAVEGTVFAPYADIVKTANQSNIEGQVIAQSYLQNGGENHYAVFDPSIAGCGVVCNLGVSGVKTDITCNGSANGAINITTSGSNGALSYLWNDGNTSEDRSGLLAGNYSVQVSDAAGCKTASETFTIAEPSAIYVSGITVDATTVSGANGSIDVTVSGGTGSYTYLWSDGPTTEDRTGLQAGNYTVTVTDKNGCSSNKAFLITEPTCSLSVVGTKTDITCHGSANGAINITVSGNNGAVSYLWNDTNTDEDRTGLSAGNYSVQVSDAAGCKATSDNFAISEPTALSVNGITVNTTAGSNNGSIDVTVSGGTAPYTYLWNDGVTTEDRTNLPAGNYSVTVTDKNGCSSTKAFLITAPVCKMKVTGKVTPVTCYGGNNGAIDLTVTGNNGVVTYLWNDGVTTEDRTGLTAGNYSVKATDAVGCSATCPKIVVKQPTKIKVTATVTGQTTTGVCDGTAKLSATGGTAPYTYTWSDGYVGAYRCSLCMGAYKVTVTDKNGCSLVYTVRIACPDKASSLVSDLAAGSLKPDEVIASVTLSPNPTTGLLKVTINAEKAGNAMITVYNLTGTALVKNTVSLSKGTNQQQLNLTSLAKGLYEVQVVTDGGARIFKVVLN